MDYIIIVLVSSIIWCLIWGYATKTVNESKGYYGGFWLGFFLNLIGLIIVACKPTIYYETNEISERDMLLSGGWKCNQCGAVNSSYVGTCSCGNTKENNETLAKTVVEKAEVKEKSEKELLNLQKLKAYKDLLDSGVISHEEIEKKKLELFI